MQERERRRAGWKKVFGIDYRSLAFFRISLALLILFDLYVRAKELTAHYTDFGVLPRGIFVEKFANKFWISIHMANGGVFFQAFLFLLAAIFAFALLFGYQTKLATIVSWFFLISLQSKNPMILQGGDILFRLLLFWAMFLPLGEKFSLDSLKKKTKKQSYFFSAGTVGILLQFAFVFVFAAFLKTGKEWLPDGTAIYYAVSIDQFATVLGKFLLNFPALMQYLTYFVFFMELLGPIFLFVPFSFGKFRTFVVFLFLILFIGMGASLNLGPFPWICSVALIIFLPYWFWDKATPILKKIFKALSINKIKKFAVYFYYNKKNTSDNKFLHYSVNALAIFFIIFVFLWNIQTLKYNAVPDSVEFIAHITRTDQYWNMFAPYPLKDDGWYVIEGKLKDRNKIDLMRGSTQVSFAKPKNVAEMYPHERWRKYLMNLWNRDNAEHRGLYLSYLCRKWNKSHVNGNKKLEEIKMYFMLEVTLPDYEKSNVEKVTLAEWKCG